MQAYREKVTAFLKKYQMSRDAFDFAASCQEFVAEMENGLAGRESSLKMIPTYIALDGGIPQGEPVIVVDAGGTNFRVAVIRFQENSDPVIQGYRVYPMPGVDREVTKEEFFKTFAYYLRPVIGQSDKIGFCFSYAIEHQKNRDGKILGLGKQVMAGDAVGEMIGESLRRALSELGCPSHKKIVIINDTIATLLSAKKLCPDRRFDSYIGFVLGTGTNTCYLEENKRILKDPSLDPAGSMLINIESGGYDRFGSGLIDREYDRSLVDTGQYTYEKMVSGRYQGGLLLAILRKAVEEGLFSAFFAEKIALIDRIDATEIDDFLYFPYGGNRLAACCPPGGEGDRVILYHLIDALLDRAARLVTVNLAGIIRKTGRGANPCLPVCVAAEGSTFRKSKLFRERLQYYLKKYLNDGLGLYCEIVEKENSTLIGTAIAGLSEPD